MNTPGRRQADHLTEPLAELVSRMRATGLEPSAEGLADALWLARLTTESRPPAGGPPAGEPLSRPSAGTPADTTRPGTGAPLPGARPGPHTTEHTAPVSLYVPSAPDAAPVRSFPIRAPATAALSGLLDLQRSLRPLRGYRPPVPPAPGRELDERATAERSAREALLVPVTRPADRRSTEIQLLMDASPTASVWQLTLERLRQACERLGAFRDVQVHYLHAGPDGTPMAGTGPDPHRTRLRPADQHRDTTGRRLTLVVSDCAGTLWQSGRAQRLLHRWAASSPVAVVQPLPPRLWDRTALPAGPGTVERVPGSSRGVRFVPDEGYLAAAPPAPGDLAVPVLLPTERVLGNWARVVGSNGGRTMRGAAAWVGAGHPPRPGPGPRGTAATPGARLRDFQGSASPGAVELAVHLAAVPLYLPVMQLVQEALLPDTGPMELAEVLLGGLLDRLPDTADVPGPQYEFAPGVREVLLRMLDRGAAELVLKYLSEYIGRRFGRGMRNFPALAVARLQGQDPDGAGPDDTDGAREGDEAGEAVREALFAHVSARVVRWYRPARPVPGRLDEAERLLGLWRDQRDEQLLLDAQRLAETAVDDGGGERARHLLGQILHARAGTAELHSGPGGARSLLLRAERLLAGDDPGAAVRRGAVQHDLWRQERQSTAWLYAAGDSLRAGGPVSDAPQTEAVRRLRLGRVLLDLARSEPDDPAHAPAAVRELRDACDQLKRTGAHPRRRAAALLDLVAALRIVGSADQTALLGLVAAAEQVADGSDALLLRCLRERARCHRELRDWDAAARGYADAERRAPRDSAVRCEVLAEWGEMQLVDARLPDRAIAILREALTNLPARVGPLRWRLHLLLGSALVERYLKGQDGGGRSLPDLYEGCHLIEQAAHHGGDPATRAASWLALAGAQLAFPGPRAHFGAAQTAYTRALRESAEVGGAPSETAARALHGRAVLYERRQLPASALDDYRAAAALWDRLADEGTPGASDEVRATRDRLLALEGTGGGEGQGPAGS
ncbi:SAV_2336 N-terminal domain-related protein [Streptomyces sp. NPDC003023]|uniref:SAV_2336 N-terminal domain-related protein n=1 Tax=Streptomyces sp. NPDC003023 TaxID=3364675 RepID=UPI0036BBFD7A